MLPPFLAPEKARFLAIPDALQAAFFPAKLALFEWSDYWFEWRGATHLQVGSQRVEPFAPNLFQVRWENALGASSIQPFRGEVALDEPLFVEIISPKFPTPDAHLAFFRALLGDLWQRGAALIYDARGQTSRGMADSDLAPSRVWTRLFLEQFGARLGEALRFFLAQAPRDLGLETTWVAASQARTFDGATLRETARAAPLWARQNGRVLPSMVAQNQALERLDTPENRFVAALCKRLLVAIEDLDGATQFREIAGVCAAIAARFPLASAEIQVSPALSRRRDTRELLELWRLWRGAGAPLFGPFDRAARVRDIAQLYEFWAFFALCKRIGAALNQTPHFEIVGDEPRGLRPHSRAKFAAGTLVFNGPAPSYSTPLRPDFLWLENGVVTLAFDAKFRLEAPENGGTLGARGADLHKMHAYRDALGVRAAVAIYPGETSLFFGQNDGGRSEFWLDALLDGSARGVGLWELRPGGLAAS